MKRLLLTVCLAVLPFVGCTREQEGEEMVHPGFRISREELAELIVDQPEDVKQAIMERPEVFLDLVDQALDTPPEATVRVDKNHPLSPDFAPADLVALKDYGLSVSRRDLTVSRAIMPDVLALVEAGRRDGVELLFSSAYRSYDYQKIVYERNVKELGQTEADRVSAKPGTSQHQLGRAIDFGSITDAFASTPAGLWMAEHAWEYGFSLSYPQGYEELTGYKWESWHFRHITREGTKLEREFFGGIQHYCLAFLADKGESLKTLREEGENG